MGLREKHIEEVKDTEKVLAEAKEAVIKFNQAKNDLVFALQNIRDNAVYRQDQLSEDYEWPEGGEDPPELERVEEDANHLSEEVDSFEIGLDDIEDLVAEKISYGAKEEKS